MNQTDVTAFPEANVSLVDAYLRGLPSEATRDAYRRVIDAFTTYLGGRDRLTVTRRDVEAYRAHLEQLGRAPSTIARALTALSGFYTYAMEEEAIERSPVKGARRPKVSDESPRQGASPAEAQAVLTAIEGSDLRALRDRAFLTALITQAWRLSEALGLHIEHLGEEAGYRVATVRRKGGKTQRVALAPAAWGALQTWIRAAEITTGPIFLPIRKGGGIQRGSAMSSWAAEKIVTARVPAGNRHLHPHLFRHGAATEALSAGVPLHQVQDHLGHSDPKTTRRYDSHRKSLANPTAAVLAARMLPTPTEGT